MARIEEDTERLLPLDGCFNFRDLGGYETADGRHVQWRVLFRADGPHALSDDDTARLARLGLHTIIDLRTSGEAETRGRYHDRVDGIAGHHLPMFDALPGEHQMSTWADPAHVAREYRRIAGEGARAIATTIGLLASPN